MASTAVQWQFLTLASVLQLLRGAAWFTIAVILGAQAIDPTIGASVTVLRNLMLPSAALAALAVLFMADGVMQVWAGYHVSTWRKSRMWLLAAAIPAVDCLVWAAVGMALEARGEFGFGLAGFIFAGFAALAAIAVTAGRTSLSGRF